MVLLFCQFNNYFNRIVRKYDTVAEYINSPYWKKPTSIGPSMYMKDINFKPNDDVETYHDANWFNSWMPDYLLVINDFAAGETPVINSRWFVKESKRLRGNQYRFQLRRDIIVDNYEGFLNSVALIQKGKPMSIDDISIYNQENFESNEIKIQESYIKDNSTTAWIVGYYETVGGASNFSIPATKPDITYNSISAWEYYDNSNLGQNNPYNFVQNFNLEWYFQTNVDGYEQGSAKIKTDSDTYKTVTPKAYPIGVVLGANIKNIAKFIVNSKEVFKTTFFTNFSDYHQNPAKIYAYEGKIIYDSTAQKYYKVRAQYTYEDVTISPTYNSTFENSVNTIIKTQFGSQVVFPTGGAVANTKIPLSVMKVSFILDDITDDVATLTGKISDTSNKLEDAPYKMFAIPYSITKIRDENKINPNLEFNSLDSSITMQIPSILAADTTNILLHDVQLLPYCPIPGQIIKYSNITNVGMHYEGLQVDEDYNLIYKGTEEVGIIFYPRKSSFQLTTPSISALTVDPTMDVETFKVTNQLQKIRFVSPNYSSSFEFKKTYNRNSIACIISATYKPYCPYINIKPNIIGGLYGRDYKDEFGLILQGDFSVPLMNSEWKQYQLNNKNYLNAFNRSIESLDIQQKFAKIRDIASAASGTVQSGASGYMVGGAAGAVYGAIIGGSLGAADVRIENQLRAEEKNVAIDQFNYNIQNVKARPHTIAKVSSFDINNKIWPIIEVYNATDWENETFKRMLKFNGYTIDRLALISDYFDNSTFIKGLIVKCEVTGDTHIINAIYEEFAKGVYANEPTI